MIFSKKSKKISEELSKKLVKHIAESGFKFWRGKEFRKMIDFENLSQTEQDRIFNEVEVTGLGLLMLHLDDIINKVEFTERQLEFANLQKAATSSFLKWLKELDIESKFVKIWKKLIDLRLDEYRKDYLTAQQESSYWKEFRGENRALRDIWVRIETLAIDSLHHIRRGKTTSKDPLWKHLRRWLLRLDVEIARMISQI